MPRSTVITSYNLTEAAVRLGVSRVTLWRHIKAGKLTIHRSGHEVIIYADDLLDYVLQQQGGRGIPQA